MLIIDGADLSIELANSCCANVRPVGCGCGCGKGGVGQGNELGRGISIVGWYIVDILLLPIGTISAGCVKEILGGTLLI